MAGEWPKVSVGDIAETTASGPFGSNIKSSEYVLSGVPIIRGFNLSGPRFLADDFVFVTEEKAGQLASSAAKPDDIVFAARGTIGSVGIVPYEPYGKYILSSNLIKLTVDPKKADPSYVFYYFRSTYGQNEINSYVSTTGVPKIARALESLRKFRLFQPPLPEQRAIAHILGTLDDKIELNRRMNETLEAMARALFKSWFVDFDPVRAKAERRDPGLPKPLADFFPDSFEDSELGEIPKEWAVRPFTESVEVIGGGTPKTSIAEYWGGDIPWFSVVDAPADSDIFVIETEKHITQKGLENSAARLLPEGTTIISARGTVGKVALVGVPMAMNQSCYGLRGLYGGAAFTYFATRSLVSMLKQRSHGSVFDTITRDTLAGVKFIAPPKAVLDAFERVADPFIQRIKGNLSESRALVAQRDALLPKLISGEIRLSDTMPTALEA